MHPFLVLRFRDAAWPYMAVRWLLVSQGPVDGLGYVCGVMSGHASSSDVRVLPEVEHCDAKILDKYEPELAEAGFAFTGESAVVPLDPGLVLGRPGYPEWPVKMMYALQDAFAARDAPHWRGTQADYDAIKNKQPGVIYEITDR